MIRHPLISDPTPEDLDAIAPEPAERRWYDVPFSAAAEPLEEEGEE